MKENFRFEEVYYERHALDYVLGQKLKEKYCDLIWTPIENHNNIKEMRTRPNSDFARMKKLLIVGTRKTHRYTPNQKISDYLVPFTSSGCTAMCLYCYLVCHYNKCSYLRLFVNREEMLYKLIKKAAEEREHTFEIGSNSDLILENTITGTLPDTIETFAQSEKGYLTFPTKFDRIDPLLPLNHKGRVIFRMSVNPSEIIGKIELGTSPLSDRIEAVNRMCDAGYPTGILVAPVIFVEGWKKLYSELFTILSEQLTGKVKKQLFIEVIFMTYSYVHRMINAEAFPNAPELYCADTMVGKGLGKYTYRNREREEGERFLREQISQKLPHAKIVYFS